MLTYPLGEIMKLTVFGATGGIGRQLIEQGLRQGHEMTAVVRSDFVAPGATVVRATLDDAAALEAAVAGRVSDRGDSLLMRAVAKPLVQRILKANFDDLAEAERILRASNLDWTLISPPRLTDAGHRPYRTVLDLSVRGGRTLSRADVADAMLRSVTDDTHIHHRVSIAY